jgi:hypothetical protein
VPSSCGRFGDFLLFFMQLRVDDFQIRSRWYSLQLFKYLGTKTLTMLQFLTANAKNAAFSHMLQKVKRSIIVSMNMIIDFFSVAPFFKVFGLQFFLYFRMNKIELSIKLCAFFNTYCIDFCKKSIGNCCNFWLQRRKTRHFHTCCKHSKLNLFAKI